MRDDRSRDVGVYSEFWIFNQMAAQSALECGGLTPPWHSISEESGGYATLASVSEEGGVKPPHSKALRACH